jgi:drug/metabolite transporter (DMT)-like permease
VETLLGILLAAGASACYSLGVVLQAMEARETSSELSLRPALVISLLSRARWLAGIGLSILGWPLQLIALLLAPLVVVQPALACGLIVLLIAAERMLQEKAGRYEYSCIGLIMVGVVGAGLFAPPHGGAHAGRQTITIVLLILALASLLPYLLAAFGRAHPMTMILGAGLAFAWSGIATALASDDITVHHWAPAVAWAVAAGAAAVIGVLSETSALQARPAIQVAPVVSVIQTVVPVVVAPLLLDEHFLETPGHGVPLAISLLILITGAALLNRSPLLVALMEESES